MYGHLCTGRKVDAAAGVVSMIMFTSVQIGREKRVQVFLRMPTCVQVGRERRMQMLYMYDHLCTGRKVDVAAHLYL